MQKQIVTNNHHVCTEKGTLYNYLYLSAMNRCINSQLLFSTLKTSISVPITDMDIHTIIYVIYRRSDIILSYSISVILSQNAGASSVALSSTDVQLLCFSNESGIMLLLI